MNTPLKERIVNAAQKASKIGLVPVTAGNFSMRGAREGEVLITPNGLPYEEMTPDDIVTVDMWGKVISGGTPSSETPLHTMILRERPDVSAVVHTHSSYATSFSVLRRDIPLIHTEGLSIGRIPVTRLATPGSAELGEVVLEAVGHEGKCALLANHGVVTMGSSIEEALTLAVLVEDIAKVYLLASMIGTPVELTAEEVRTMKEAIAERKRREREASSRA